MPQQTVSASAAPNGATPKAGPCAMVIFGGGGDLTKRLVTPALYNLATTGLLPDGFAIVGVDHAESSDHAWRDSLDAMMRSFVGGAGEFDPSQIDAEAWDGLKSRMFYLQGDFEDPGTFEAVGRKLAELEKSHGTGGNALFYLAVADRFFGTVVDGLGEAGLTRTDEGGPWRRVVIEKPFGHDLASAKALNARVLTVLREDQVYRIDHFLGKETVQNITAFRFANGLFEPIWSRNFIDHVQIDIPETLGLESRIEFYEATGAYRDMVVTHLLQVLAFIAIEPPTALEPRAISEEKNKVFRSLMPIDPRNVVRGQYDGYRDEDGVSSHSDTETFIALKCEIDNWRWAGVPFYLRTGKRLAEGQRIVSIAFREAPKSMFPPGSGVGTQGPDHLTFDLADASRLSLSFYGKRPGPGMRLEKLSMQFATSETEQVTDVLEAYERLILDTLRGDHTLFTTAEGIESLWERSTPLLEDPPPVKPYAPGSWGPNAIHQLIAPNAWRLPFERVWRRAR